MRVAVLANLKQNAPVVAGSAPDHWAELDSPKTVDAIVAALRGAGHEAAFFEGDLRLVHELPAFRPDLCFNLCEGHFGDSREAHVPALLEMLRIPYTGAAVGALALTLDKPLTKRVLLSHGLNTPEFQVFETADDPMDPTLSFPLIVKPSHEGSGMGVSDDSVVTDEGSLRRAVAALIERYHQPALVERFVTGREVTVGLVGNRGDRAPVWGAWSDLPRIDGVMVLPVYELLFPDEGMYTSAMKSQWVGDWVEGTHYRCPADLPSGLVAEIHRQVVGTFVATACRDVSRVDLRLDAARDHKPYVLEINALPGMSPGWSDLVLEAQHAGLSYDDLVLGITEAALRRGAVRGARG